MTVDGDYTWHITHTVDGHFIDKHHVRGTFTAHVKVMRVATVKKVDSCYVSTRWHAAR